MMSRCRSGRKKEVIEGKECSKLRFGHSSSFRSTCSSVSSHFSFSSSMVSRRVVQVSGPFSGLVICVTGLSKETRRQVMDATERLGGWYSPDLHCQCTHLVVQSFGGRKFEHALKYGSKKGLFVVTLGWFVDSVRKNVRLNESLYIVKNTGENGCNAPDNSCLDLPRNVKLFNKTNRQLPKIPEKKSDKSMESTLCGNTMYIDLDVSDTLRCKVIQAASGEGATFVDQWFIDCGSDYVVCEETSIHKYLGHVQNLVTPLWVLKTAKEKNVQRLVHMSADLARMAGTVLADVDNGIVETNGEDVHQYPSHFKINRSLAEREKITNLAKIGVRHRRTFRMQTCQTQIRPLTPSSLMDSICWSVSEPTSIASVYIDCSTLDDDCEEHPSIFFDAKCDVKESDSSLPTSSRLLTESEKSKVVLRNHFLTILFPMDRFAEMGLSSRTFFSEKGFTCLQVLDHIYAFYQEKMSSLEIGCAIHTDSKHADRLRSMYSSSETVGFKRADFLGSRKSFELLKRVSGENNYNVYELMISA